MKTSRPTDRQVRAAIRTKTKVQLLGGPRDLEYTELDCQAFVCAPPFQITPDRRTHHYALRSVNGELRYVHSFIDLATETRP